MIVRVKVRYRDGGNFGVALGITSTRFRFESRHRRDWRETPTRPTPTPELVTVTEKYAGESIGKFNTGTAEIQTWP